MLYGYDAHVVKADAPVSNNGIGDHARSLLSALAMCRQAEKSASGIFTNPSLPGNLR